MTAHTEGQQRPTDAIPDAIQDAIPWETALQLCATLWAENRHRWYTPNGMMCRGCMRFSAGDPAKRCFANRPDNRGCYQINARYDAQWVFAQPAENVMQSAMSAKPALVRKQ